MMSRPFPSTMARLPPPVRRTACSPSVKGRLAPAMSSWVGAVTVRVLEETTRLKMPLALLPQP